MEILFYILVCFPFVKWLGIGTASDVQYYSLFFSIVLAISYGVTFKIKLNRTVVKISILILFSVLISCIFTFASSGMSFDGVARYIGTYVGIIIYILTTYNLLCQTGKINEFIIKLCINIYLIVGIVQAFFKNDFMYGWIANARTSANRGAISLTSEPSFYGYMCIFLILLALRFKKNRIFYIVNLLFQILVLARSSVTTLYLMIFVGLIVCNYLNNMEIKKTLESIFVTGGLIILGYYILLKYGGKTRMAHFINILLTYKGINNLTSQFKLDGSVFIRFNDIAYCLEGFVRNCGIPHGFNTRKISSGYGSLLYTMGWLGAIIILYFYRIMKSNREGLNKIVPLFITIILFSAIQLSNPMIGFYIGKCIWEQDEMEQKLRVTFE